ncbi:uncharacterized protein LOC109417842 [Aedes albopictus]|uniref:Uncharacterized protein n=1 Tax=Aedes albopictus TaxID=7160 RepID=A0ABM1YRI7_AEDAL
MRRASSTLSTQRLAVLTAVSTHNMIGNQTVSYYNAAGNSSSSVRGSGHHHQGLQTLRPGANMHGNVNVMLGGAMLSVVITVLCFVCYCCHRNIKKRSNSIYRQQWLENEANMEIYSVEQCYDTPTGYGPSSVGIDDNGVNSVRCGPYFMENSSGNEYQPIPATAAASAVQVQQHPHQYSHLFNGPPPSYDAVLAQDEIAATSKSRPKSSDLCSTLSSDGGESNPRGLSAKLERLLNDPTGTQRRKRMEPDFTDLGRMIGLPGCDEIGNCSCPLSDSLQVYCRKCGQYVDGGLVQNHLNNNQLLGCEESTTGGGGNTNWTGSTAIGCDNLMDCDDGDNNGNSIQITNSDNGITYRSISGSALNELLLQDLQFHSTDDTVAPATMTAAAATTGELDNDWSCCTGRDDARHNEENNNNLTSSASLPPLLVIARTIPVDGSAVGGAFVPADTGSNNANSPNNNGNHESAQATVEVGAGPNGGEGNKPAADNDGGDTFRNLTENGLVRLDMSQIIDQTGLPTYEAALRLESSGYV